MSTVKNPLNSDPSPQHLLISGGTGFVASQLIRSALAAAQKVTVLTRSPERVKSRFPNVLAYSRASAIPLQNDITAVVHLCGANVFALPWSKARKALILSSRLEIGEEIQAAMAHWQAPPKVWVQASAMGFYPVQSEHPLDENSAAGSHFPSQVCQSVEAMARNAEALGMRSVSLRFGLIFGREGGVYPLMRLGTLLSGANAVGNGLQPTIWIHIKDAVGLIMKSISDPNVSGPINAVAPDQPSNQEFVRIHGQILRRPAWFRVPASMLKLLTGERAEFLLNGARLSTELVESKYSFLFPKLTEALKDLG